MELAISRVGMITGVGLNAAATCAALRCAIDNFQETRFMIDGDWQIACEVPLPQPWRGERRLRELARAAILDCLDGFVPEPGTLPLFLCLPETDRPGRLIHDDNRFFLDLEKDLGWRCHSQSCTIAMGRVSIGVALRRARKLFQDRTVERILIAACDSYLTATTLEVLAQEDRLLTGNNSDGFIPGEAGSALMVEPAFHATVPLKLVGLGFGVEPAPINSGKPLRAEGLTRAIKQALQEAGLTLWDLDFRITDIAGEQYYFKEATLALARTLRVRKEFFDIWHPADCIGETGAAVGAVMIGMFKAACEKGYSQGAGVLLHLGNDDGRRVAMVLRWEERDGQ